MGSITPEFSSEVADSELPSGLQEAIHRVLERAAQDCTQDYRVNILFTDETGIQALNRDFRGTDSPTDVLSFPASEFRGMLEEHVRGGGDVERDGQLIELGDIAIYVQRAAQQAQEIGHTLTREIQFLALHGCLHLLGYDHMTPEEEEIMTAAQRKVMKDYAE